MRCTSVSDRDGAVNALVGLCGAEDEPVFLA